MKKYRFITIKQVEDELFAGKPVYRIYNNKHGDQLGIIHWFKQWKCYVLSSRPECVLNESCLLDVAGFMKKYAGKE